MHQNQKKIDESFTKRIGFMSGPCATAASPDHYVDKLLDTILNSHGAIEVKK